MNKKISHRDTVILPMAMLPNGKTQIAFDSGVEKNILVKCWGGLGDRICSEPTLRYMLKQFNNCDISLYTEHPEIFSHLNFKEIYTIGKDQPILENFLVFETITPPNESNLVWQFFSHMLVNCVDFPSMCALRMQLPVKDREVLLRDVGWVGDFYPHNSVIVHAGKHWQSKTFPKPWWDNILKILIKYGMQPVLIGANTDDNRGTVDVEADGCIDLRNKLSIMETISLLKKSKVLLTNDSSPLHMAVDSDAWILYVASCKHPDYITHWRRGQWGWRMQNLGLDGAWNHIDNNPNQSEGVSIEVLPKGVLERILPDPEVVAFICKEKLYAK